MQSPIYANRYLIEDIKERRVKIVRGLFPHLALITPSIFIISVFATYSCLAYVILEIFIRARRLLIAQVNKRRCRWRDERCAVIVPSSFFFAMVRSSDQVHVNGNNILEKKDDGEHAPKIYSRRPWPQTVRLCQLRATSLGTTFSPTFSPSFSLFLSFNV